MRELSTLENISQLPDLALCNLDSWDLISVKGEDRIKFLQGQLTCDLEPLKPGDQTIAAQCDAKGKTLAIFRLLVLSDRILLTQPKAATDKQLPELKKYAVFSKVEIELETEYQMLGLLGAKSADYLAQHQGRAAVHEDSLLLDNGILVKQPYPSLRYLVVLKNATAQQVITELAGKAELFCDSLWNALNIASGVGFLESITMSEFIPQALNLQALNAISFEKGCYIGQETVARAKFRGTNKRAMYILSGRAESKPNAGDTLEVQMGDNWKRVGTVISGCQYGDKHVELLAVLPNNSDHQDSLFRLKDQPESQIYSAPLPYELEEN